MRRKQQNIFQTTGFLSDDSVGLCLAIVFAQRSIDLKKHTIKHAYSLNVSYPWSSKAYDSVLIQLLCCVIELT